MLNLLFRNSGVVGDLVMKRVGKSSGLFLLLTFSLVMTAQAVEENHETNKFSIGLEYDKIRNKELRAKDPEGVSSLKITQSSQFYYVFSWTVMQNNKFTAGVYGKVGKADLTLRSLDNIFQNTLILKYDSGLALGTGVTLKYDLDDTVGLSANAEYKQFRADLDSASYFEEEGFSFFGEDHVKVKDFETSLFLSKKISCTPFGGQLLLRPYGGPLLHWTRIQTGSVNFETPSFELVRNVDMGGTPRKKIGWIIGVDLLTLHEALKLSLEYEFLSEDSLRLSVRYNF